MIVDLNKLDQNIYGERYVTKDVSGPNGDSMRTITSVPSGIRTTQGPIAGGGITGRVDTPPINSRAHTPPASESSFELGTNVLQELMSDLTKPLLKAEDETKPPEVWEPKKLLPRHREIMRRILEGASYVEIAEELGISPQAITLISNTAIFKEELKKLEDSKDWNVVKRAEELSNEALDTLKMSMRRARTESVRVNSAIAILDRAGYGKVEKRVNLSVGGEEVIRELNRRRREAHSANVESDTGAGATSIESTSELISTSEA